MTRLVVIDGDIISYRSAAANEKRTVIATHKDTAESLEFNTATAFKEWAGEGKDSYDVTPKQTAAPLANALHILKETIERIVEACKADSYHVVLSGKENFRLELPLPSRYKNTRQENLRPVQLKDCREYLLKFHDAEVSVGEEADDVLVAYAVDGYNNKRIVIQATLDKDSKHGPGWVYDWTTMTEPELIEGYGELELIVRDNGTKSVKGKGRAFLYYQLLFGDPVDAYKPCELAKAKFGEIGAYNLLKGASNDKEALEIIVKQYKQWYPCPINYNSWDNTFQSNKSWLDIMQLYADCCFMRRFEDDRLDIKNLLTKLEISYE